MPETTTSGTGSRAPAARADRQRGAAPPGPPGPPVARRLRQPSWRDVRLLVGVSLVLVCVVVGALVVSGADRSTPTYVATRALVPGESLAADDVAVVGARVAGDGSPYLRAAGGLRPGLVVLRSVLPGELVPVSAVGDRSQVSVRPVTVPVDPGTAESLTTGRLVDVWVAARRDEGGRGYVEPHRVASGVPVGQRATRRGALGGSSTTGVQVLVDEEVVPRLIHAVDDEARITLVPAPGAEGTTS